MKKTVGIIGATGYAGVELIRLLIQHPDVSLTHISSKSFEGNRIDEVYPTLVKACSFSLEDEQTVAKSCDVVFCALPHGHAENLAKICLEAGGKFIDLGADFRLKSSADYERWYGQTAPSANLLSQAIYSIPELLDQQIKNEQLIANPGCYPTSITLGLAPAIQNHWIDVNSIIIDAKSGTTGAGRALSENTHFPQCNENFAPYKIAQHRHTPEIEQTLSEIADESVTITFVPHLLPINRGIESTIYANLNQKIDLQHCIEDYQKFYNEKPFVRVMEMGEIASINLVKYSNFCNISLHMDERTNRLIIVSVIDNMMKGAAGQAIQNMNLILGIEEQAGLTAIPPAF